MSSSDVKFFALILIIGGAAYFLFFNDFKWSEKRGGLQGQGSGRTVTFVPEGTPGAITVEEWQRRERARHAIPMPGPR